MQLTIRCIGQKGPAWLQAVIDSYSKRLPQTFGLTVEIFAHSKHKNPEQQKTEEGKLLLKDLPKNSLLISTDILGKNYSSEEFAKIIETKQNQYQKAVIFIGGCHGLSQEVKQLSHLSWSLSRLTLPHPHVRLILVEQWYRAYCIHNQHPYHK